MFSASVEPFDQIFNAKVFLFTISSFVRFACRLSCLVGRYLRKKSNTYIGQCWKKIFVPIFAYLCQSLSILAYPCLVEISCSSWQQLTDYTSLGVDIIDSIKYCAFIGIGIWAFQSGDPSKLLFPTNSFGQICGQANPHWHQNHQNTIMGPSPYKNDTLSSPSKPSSNQEHVTMMQVSCHLCRNHHLEIDHISAKCHLCRYPPPGRSSIPSLPTLLWSHKGKIDQK